MKIEKNGTMMTVFVSGKLDAMSSPELEAESSKYISGVDKVVLDLKDAIYISSAGLRVILGFEKKMEKVGGSLTIRNVPDLVMEVFVETGLTDILTLE